MDNSSTEQRTRALTQPVRDVIRGELSVQSRDLLLAMVQLRKRSLESDVAHEMRIYGCYDNSNLGPVYADLAKVNTALDELCEYGSGR